MSDRLNLPPQGPPPGPPVDMPDGGIWVWAQQDQPFQGRAVAFTVLAKAFGMAGEEASELVLAGIVTPPATMGGGVMMADAKSAKGVQGLMEEFMEEARVMSTNPGQLERTFCVYVVTKGDEFAVIATFRAE